MSETPARGTTHDFPTEPEEVFTVFHRSSRLHAAVAINSTVLGPALGGTRFRSYPTLDAAVADARNLAGAMTLKNAVAGIDFGGGKAVIIGDPGTEKTPELLDDYARLLNTLRGRYITAEDVGMTISDMDRLRQTTEHVAGISVDLGGSGDPSPLTAVGVMSAIEAASEHTWGTPELAGRHVSVSGLGKVGGSLARLLIEAGCNLTVSDISEPAVDALRRTGSVSVVPTEDAHRVPCDIFAPCALGGVLNEHTVSELRCHVVCGAANNQLTSPEIAGLLRQSDILYVPDFVANAGGVINIANEHGGYDPERALAQVKEISRTVTRVLRTSSDRGITPLAAATDLARERLTSA
jgi:glutamate dehydrogenase/leucine dehydrogenase